MTQSPILVPDDGPASLEGAEIPSLKAKGVRYRVSRLLGEGGMGSAFLAARVASDGVSLVVLKVLHPWFVKQSGQTASLIVEKEVVALSRLNERVPPTPFVVRMIDSGNVPVRLAKSGVDLNLPWLAIEHMHGGPEGTTLTERVEKSIRSTGYAFDPARAAHAIDCLGRGAAAIHDVGVIHRDLTPNNVLCCGFGEEEMFKIADFGIARPAGVAATFGGIILGTPGYAAPEQAMLDERRMGSWTDVFGLAAVIYFMLTGEDYFQVNSPMDALRVVKEPMRRKLAEAQGLSPELRERQGACASIDDMLARATSIRGEERPQSTETLTAPLLAWLKVDSRRYRPSADRLQSVVGAEDHTQVSGWTWTVRHQPGDDRVVRHVSWDGDGRCLAATSQGLAFWNGTSWDDVPLGGLPNPEGIRFVHRMAAGRWLIGGDGATFAVYETAGVTDVVRWPNPEESFSHANGDLNDLAVFVGAKPNEPPSLYALTGRRWLRPVSLSKAAYVSGLARIDDDRWLVTGRKKSGGGFVAVYSPLNWEAVPVALPEVRALVACAGLPDRQQGLAVGSDGLTVWFDGSAGRHVLVPDKPDLSAAAISVGGRGWVAAAGRIWIGGNDARAKWWQAWSDPSWVAPIVSLFADVGVLLAMTADGGILEGRDIAEFAREIAKQTSS